MAEEPEVEPGATPVEETQPSTPGAKLRAAREAREDVERLETRREVVLLVGDAS